MDMALIVALAILLPLVAAIVVIGFRKYSKKDQRPAYELAVSGKRTKFISDIE